VAAAARGRGSAALLAISRRWSSRAGAELLRVRLDFNDGARRFYARHGYAHVGTLPDLLVRGSAGCSCGRAAGRSAITRDRAHDASPTSRSLVRQSAAAASSVP
jgi:hypothetical protein